MDHLCAVCEGGREQGEILLCTRCLHPSRVRTYCTRCTGRLDLSLEEAQTLFAHADLKIDRAGIVFRLNGCAVCQPHTSPMLEVSFANLEDGFPPCHVA